YASLYKVLVQLVNARSSPTANAPASPASGGRRIQYPHAALHAQIQDPSRHGYACRRGLRRQSDAGLEFARRSRHFAERAGPCLERDARHAAMDVRDHGRARLGDLLRQRRRRPSRDAGRCGHRCHVRVAGRRRGAAASAKTHTARSRQPHPQHRARNPRAPAQGDGMKIVDIRLTGLSGGTVEGGWADELTPEDDINTVVEVLTDEGLTGIGSAMTSKALVAAGVKLLKPLLIGERADEPARVTERLRQTTFWQGRGGAVEHAISGIDIA